MRWIYKIWGGFDGFRPKEIPNRLEPGGELNLGWAKYADVAEPGEEVWVWFHEAQKFTPGVYAKGIVESVDPVAKRLVLQTQDWSDTAPLTTAEENAVLASVVAAKNRQVFVLPDDFRRFDNCTATVAGASSCAARNCDYCTYWGGLPVIKKTHVRTSELLAADLAAFAPAYWVVANRSWAWNNSARLRSGVRATTNLFYRFKTGEAALAYPLAKGMVQALAQRGALEAGAIIPIALSPDKVAAGEIHRTKLLSQSLSRQLQVPMLEAVKLRAPIGKRAAQQAGIAFSDFRTQYASLLDIKVHKLNNLGRIILVDDVCTYGHTLAATVSALRDLGVTGEIVACTAGQMTIRDAVLVDSAVLKP